jgi:hypothetical protein
VRSGARSRGAAILAVGPHSGRQESGGRGYSLAANLGWSYRVFCDASGPLCSRDSAKRYFSEDEPAGCIEPCRPTLVAKK